MTQPRRKKTPDPAADPIKAWAAEHGITMREEIIALDHLHPNPWNPNRMDDRTRQATRDSIAMFGFIDWPHVREHPDLDGHYQLLDGEHRVGEARELDLEAIPCVVLDVDTPTAMKLTVVLNQKGHNDDVVLGALLGELEKHGGEDWTRALAFDDATLRHLIELGASEWTPPQGDGNGLGVGAGDGTDDEWRSIDARVPAAVHDLWEQARERAIAAGELGDHDDARVAAGLFIVVLVASYLATPADDAADADA